MPRPLARSGWVMTSFRENPALTRRSSVGTAKTGVPQKTRFIIKGSDCSVVNSSYHSPAFTILRILRFIMSRFSALMWLMYSFPLRWSVSCSKARASSSSPVTSNVSPLRFWARAVTLRARVTFSRNSGRLRQPPFDVNDLRVDQHDFGLGVFLEGHVDHRDSLADADLRSGQPDSVSGIHALEHVINQLSKLVIELGNRGRWLFQNRIAVFDDGIDHLEVLQLLAVAFVISLQLQHRITTELLQRKTR